MIDFKSFSRRIFLLALLIVLFGAGAVPAFATVAGIPSLKSQTLKLQPAVLLAAWDQPQIVSDKPVKGETKAEAKSEAEETNVYRHSATVQWFAKTFHIDVELAAQLFEWINFAIVILAVGIPLIKVVPKMLRKRTETLSHELQAAQAATQSANARLSVVEAKLAGLDSEIAAIRKQVEEDMREDEVRIKASIEEESARIVTAAEHEIQVAAMQAQRGLKQYAADLAIDRAMGQLTLNADTDRALIAEFARDSRPAGKTRKSAAGGQD